jgi:uncharacterized protein
MADLHSLAVELPDGVDAVELHGAICGIVCADPAGDLDARRRTLVDLLGSDAEGLGLPHDDLGLEIDDPLARFIVGSAAVLDAADLSFAPLLPDDDERLDHRLTALGEWCAGFLAGYRALAEPDELPADAREALDDIAELAEIEPDLDETAEGEADFTEVVEYLRVAVLLLRGAGSERSVDEQR